MHITDNHIKKKGHVLNSSMWGKRRINKIRITKIPNKTKFIKIYKRGVDNRYLQREFKNVLIYFG